MAVILLHAGYWLLYALLVFLFMMISLKGRHSLAEIWTI
jgi:hypothetical protein